MKNKRCLPRLRRWRCAPGRLMRPRWIFRASGRWPRGARPKRFRCPFRAVHVRQRQGVRLLQAARAGARDQGLLREAVPFLGARDEREPQRRRAQGPAQGQRVRRHPRRGDEADRPHAQRPSAQVPELAHAPRGVHGASAPLSACRGLTPHRSLKWPAREGGFRLAASRRPLRGRLHPSSRAGLAFGAHQARSSAEARFTSRTENCYTTNQSQESTCLTMLHNECCVGYWKAGMTKL